MNVIRCGTRWKFLATLMVSFAFVGCGSEESRNDAELDKATAFVKYLTSKRFLRRSAFSHSYPEKKPSQFVSYLFSPMGSAEWVMTGDPLEAEQMRSIGVPIPPPSVRFNRSYSPGPQKQIVLKGDDSRGMIIVEGYAADLPSPVFTREFAFSP